MLFQVWYAEQTLGSRWPQKDLFGMGKYLQFAGMPEAGEIGWASVPRFSSRSSFNHASTEGVWV